MNFRRFFALVALLFSFLGAPAFADEGTSPTPDAIATAAVEGLKKAHVVPQEMNFSCVTMLRDSLSTAVSVYGTCLEKSGNHMLLLVVIQEGPLTPPEDGGTVVRETLQGANVDVLVHDSPKKKSKLLGRLTIGYRYGTRK